MIRKQAALFAVLALGIAVIAMPVRAQIPDEFKNLKVLPKTTDKGELVQTMKGITQGLGVRCNFCHVGEGNDLSTYDFASDQKPNKDIAREMLRMVMDINQNHMKKLTIDDKPAPMVRCVTCHRGKPEPGEEDTPE